MNDIQWTGKLARYELLDTIAPAVFTLGIVDSLDTITDEQRADALDSLAEILSAKSANQEADDADQS